MLHIELHIRPEKYFRISHIALVFSTVIRLSQQKDHSLIKIQMIAQSPGDFLQSTGQVSEENIAIESSPRIVSTTVLGLR